MKLKKLISQIQTLDGSLKQEANKAVNRLLTIRNWLIGHYIVEYEQKGEDKSKYGANLLDILSESLNIKGLSVTNLKLNRLFYITYPQIRQTVSDELKNSPLRIGQTPSDELNNSSLRIGQTLSDEFENNIIKSVQQPSELSHEAQLAEKIISKLSFSHITILLSLSDNMKRAFYAIETTICKKIFAGVA